MVLRCFVSVSAIVLHTTNKTCFTCIIGIPYLCDLNLLGGVCFGVHILPTLVSCGFQIGLGNLLRYVDLSLT